MTPEPLRASQQAELSGHDAMLLRATQSVRVHQSHRTLPVVIVTAVVFLLSLWDDVTLPRLGAWIGLILLAALVRTVVCRDIARQLDDAALEQLPIFERRLFATAIFNSTVVGSGFWWVGLEGSEHAVFVVTLACCFYAIGSMINASVQRLGFWPLVSVNLGQGIVFFSGLGGELEPAVLMLLVGMLVLLIGFGHENAHAFSESVSMREENVMLVEQLNAEKHTVEEALAKAREADASKSRFLAAASHDLRQPLHALSLFLGSLSLLIKGGEAATLVRRIGDTTEVLRAQFNALLDLSRFDAGGVQVELSDFRLDSLLERVSEEARPEADEKGLSLTLVSPPLTVRSDRLLVERVVQNLLGNAIRYTAHGGVTVLVSVDAGVARVSVSDSGPGISTQDQARIFDDFVQIGNAARRRNKGIGIGLAIVRRIDRLLGLDLDMQSTARDGSRFQFQLPLIGTQPELVERDCLPTAAPTGFDRALRVWAVDDDPDVGEALCTQLRSWRCSPLLAGSRKELEQAVGKGADWPDAALVDDMLGDEESGLDVAEWLSARIGRQRVVMVTGNTDPVRLAEIRTRGFRLLLKPADPKEIMEILQQCAETD